MVVCLLFLGYHRLTSIFHSLFSRLLTDSGFRLPTEGQKIERILQSFGTIYQKENPSYFDDPGVCASVHVYMCVCASERELYSLALLFFTCRRCLRDGHCGAHAQHIAAQS